MAGPRGKVVERIGCFGEPGVDVAVVIKIWFGRKIPSRVLAATVADTAVAIKAEGSTGTVDSDHDGADAGL